MRTTNFVLTVCVLFVLTFFGCDYSNTQPKPKLSEAELKEKLIEANKNRVSSEKNVINAYIKKNKWKVTESGTGLHYEVLKQGSGDSIKVNDRITVDFAVMNLANDTIYSSKEKGSQSFQVGMDHIETGIHEVAALLKVGDEVRVILPAHLAHGLMGDDNSIAENATLVYYLKVLAKE